MAMNIFVDTDGCLIDYDDKPRREIIKFVKFLAKHTTADLYCWSGGGADYARMWAERLGIDHLFKGFATKFLAPPNVSVDLAIDDEDVKLGAANLRIK
jgi:hypothetical protein